MSLAHPCPVARLTTDDFAVTLVMQELNLDSLPDNEFMELYQFASTQRTHEARVGRITAGEMTPHEMAQTVQADLGAPREPK